MMKVGRKKKKKKDLVFAGDLEIRGPVRWMMMAKHEPIRMSVVILGLAVLHVHQVCSPFFRHSETSRSSLGS